MKKIIGLVKKIINSLKKPKIKKEEQKIEVISQELVKEKPLRYVYIGIDYGTSGTKVMWKDPQVTRKVYVIEFPEIGSTQFNNLIVPSVVHLHSRKFYFGHLPSEDITKGETFVSLKKLIGYEVGLLKNPLNLTQDFKNHSKSKEYFPPSRLSTLFLAYIIRETVGIIKNFCGENYILRPYYILGIPYHFYNNSVCKEIFEKSFFIAWLIKDTVFQGIEKKEAFDIIREAETIYHATPSEERLTIVAPDTYVSVFEQIQRPTHPEGLHAIVDIGAGTTDITFFYFARPYAESPKISTYSTRAYDAGTDDLDSLIVDKISGIKKDFLSPTERRNLLFQLREIRPNLKEKENISLNIRNQQMEVSYTDYLECAKQLAEKLYRYYQETSYEGCKRKKKEKLWEELFLYLGGGGSCIKEIKKKFSEPLPLSVPSKSQKLELGTWGLPQDIVTRQKGWVEKNFFFFPVAYGLTSYLERWKDVPIRSPEQIRPEPKKEILKIPDIHDIEETR